MKKTCIYVSYAPGNKKEGMMLGDQCRNPFSTFAVIGGSEEMQGNDEWETQTRERIKQAQIVVMFVGKDTAQAANVIREIGIAREEGIPVMGVYVDKAYQDSVPVTFGKGPMIELNWEHVCNTILNIVSKTSLHRGFA
ncbi:MAG: TIR domain-containing protein [Syntrophaceae bacterium]|nr:TIR domain-containing protein [Syntrophaceae bacterium]